ncbi:unconventional myosin-Vb-like isoform X2 [Phymastichus coffea]|nr:unconventional myosin-Vb-like isoform X2 [Phymastichus coffea]
MDTKEDQFKKKILASLIILQAFGHAGTKSNHDSSRFGKFVQIQYDTNYRVIGALLTTYYFDSSNIISQGLYRQMFNIFYYMYAAEEYFSVLQLDKAQYDYASDSEEDSYEKPYQYMHDRIYFDKTIEAFNMLEFSEMEQYEILQILAVLLHIRSLEFKKLEGMATSRSMESCTIVDQDPLKKIGKILGLNEQAQNTIQKWMCCKRIFYKPDELIQPMTLNQVLKSRDTFARFIYTQLFGTIVTRINNALRSSCRIRNFIGILDGHGIENLESNSLEQLCINYIDEKVEQLFIQINLKCKQEEYLKEGIGWTFMEFSDNINCLEMLECKSGILDLLEEDTKVKSERSLLWLECSYILYGHTKNFIISTENTDFTIRHFLYPVRYTTNNFLSKNDESVNEEQLEVFMGSKNTLMIKLVNEELSKINMHKFKRTMGVRKRASYIETPKKTVISELQTSFTVLTETWSKTRSHFVRCIQSNNIRKPYRFDSQHVVEQLRAYNVVQAIKVSAAMKLKRMCYEEFTQRYSCLSQLGDVISKDKRKFCRIILSRYGKIDNVKFGHTKVFFDHDVFDYLQNICAKRRSHAAIVIQKLARRFLQQTRYNEIRRAICGIQPYAHGHLVRRLAQSLLDRTDLEHFAAIKIQACFRGFLQRRWYQYIKYSSIQGSETNQQSEQYYLENLAATEIQKHVKSFIARQQYKRTVRKIIIVQSLVRRFLVIQRLKKRQARNDLHFTVLHRSTEIDLDSLGKKIDYLMSTRLSYDDIVSLHSIMDNQTSIPVKNRILNKLLFKRVKTAKDLSTIPSPCEILQEVDRDADIVQQTANIAEVPSTSGEQKEYNKDTEELKEPIQVPGSSQTTEQQKKLEDRIRKITLTHEETSQDSAQRYSSPESSSKKKSIVPFSRPAYLDEEYKKKMFECDNPEDQENVCEESLTETIKYEGMFQFDLKATHSVIDNLTDVNPSMLIECDQSLDLPAQILMMCIRYADYENNRAAAVSLIHNFRTKVKHVVENQELFDIGVFWFLNTCRLLNYLKQYSKKTAGNQPFDRFRVENTVRQKQQCLKNIDLGDSLCILQENSILELISWIIRKMKTSDLVVHGVTSLFFTEQISDLDIESETEEITRNIDMFISELSEYHKTFIKFEIDYQLVIHIFKSIFEQINSITLNVILSRNEFCSVSKGVQIRCNLRIIERWLIDRQLSMVNQKLIPVIQAARLIQLQPISRNTLLNIFENYDKLNCEQIVNIFELYNTQCLRSNPSNQEVLVSHTLIDELKKMFERRQKSTDTVVVDIKARPTDIVPFRHSKARLEQVEIPSQYNLPMLKKI